MGTSHKVTRFKHCVGYGWESQPYEKRVICEEFLTWLENHKRHPEQYQKDGLETFQLLCDVQPYIDRRKGKGKYLNMLDAIRRRVEKTLEIGRGYEADDNRD